MPLEFPRVPGHEIVGDVVAISANESKWQLGQRVGAGWHGGHCHTCPRCAIGEYFTCSKVDINGTGSTFKQFLQHADQNLKVSCETEVTPSTQCCGPKLCLRYLETWNRLRPRRSYVLE